MSSKTLKEGYVDKKKSKSVFASYTKRYLVLTQTHIYYYHECPTSIDDAAEFKSMLSEVKDAFRWEDQYNCGFELSIVSRKLIFRCSPDETDSWLETIQSVKSKFISTNRESNIQISRDDTVKPFFDSIQKYFNNMKSKSVIQEGTRLSKDKRIAVKR